MENIFIFLFSFSMPQRKHSNIHNLDLMPSIYSSDSIAKEAYLHAYSIFNARYFMLQLYLSEYMEIKFL